VTISGDPNALTEPLLTTRIQELMAERSAAIGLGRYGEPRLLYSTPLFAGEEPSAERRTIHLGIDLFAPAGTPVRAPLAGTVRLAVDNEAPLDYGPLIILEHRSDDGDRFYTLYGHLSRESLVGRADGQPVAPGEAFAAIGASDVNGGWTPHLHFQLVIDLIGMDREFPGVCRASEREIWKALSPDPGSILRLPGATYSAEAFDTEAAVIARSQRIGRSLSIGYRDPVRLARGWMQYLYDHEGRRYLDAYNNVPHVGHCHPRVVRAVAEQLQVLNTNTRYLHDSLAAYADRLAATLPDPLRVCYFVNSGSEANELALRLARAHTGRRALVVLDAAYHGNTTTLIDISPYKFNGPGGQGAPPWVHVVPLPDVYRGEFRGSAAGARYAEQVKQTIAGTLGDGGNRLCGFIAETCPSVGGQIVLPPDYLRQVYRDVRAAGGLCIADEVQTGYGRMGTHFYAFEAHGVVPDIVVLGKPIGNGYPLGAVVTSRAIADSFDTGMEFFSTFGGSTPSCAAGIAVLNVIQDERLQAHAARTGERLLAGLRALGERHEIAGDVRGSGLFLGVELVTSRDSRAPASAEASYVANRMREEGILLGTDGPYHNVIKIRPPMPFNGADADRLVETLDRVLLETRSVRRV
jgi:4-aminobutyrate aminotransferase-like enzyme